MAVRAYKIVSGYPIEYTFECGQFDAMQANGAGWTEIWRDCSIGGRLRRTLYPYASGLLGYADLNVNISNSRQRHQKYFQETGDAWASSLDLSDVNGGFLPLDPCSYIEVYQNGKKLPCSAITVNYSTSTITIASEWLVPGASYEVLFWASPVS